MGGAEGWLDDQPGTEDGGLGSVEVVLHPSLSLTTLAFFGSSSAGPQQVALSTRTGVLGAHEQILGFCLIDWKKHTA